MAKFDLLGAGAAWTIGQAALGENRRLLQEANRVLCELTEELAFDQEGDEWCSEAGTREEKEQVEARIADLIRQETELKEQLRLSVDEVVIAKLELEALWDAAQEASKTA